MKKMLFVFNPRSGKEQIKGQLMEILDIFTKAGYELRVHVTQKQKDAMEVVARLGKKVDVVVCSGGDGTLNETISGMMKLKKMPLLGYIPPDPPMTLPPAWEYQSACRWLPGILWREPPLPLTPEPFART